MTDPQVLGGRYELAELLGQGGMAEVFRGRDNRLGRNVAVKILRIDLARDPSFERRFEREAQAAAGMNHPNVVAVFDTGADSNGDGPIPYIVMEYVDGTTLKDLLSTGRRLLPERALEITAGVLSALEYSHDRGIVHRDIKPANVMLTRTGEVKVMDFGIARAMDDAQATMTQASTVMGTAQYLSPEQGRGETADARSDLYAAGCLLYELLTSRPPFSGDTTASVIYQHVRENPIPPSQIDPEVPAAVDAIVMKAMAKNPENRYQTAAEMRSDVLRAIEGSPVRATPLLEETTALPMTQAIPLSEAEDDNKGRRAGYIALGIAAVAVLLIGGFFLLRPLFATEATVKVPDVVGLTVPAAEAALESEGLLLGEQTAEASTAPEDTIIRQDPAADGDAPEGTLVNVVVSSGPEQATVPALVGLTLDQALNALERAGLEVGEREERASSRPAGTILEANPAEGSNVEAGSAVDLVIASGRVVVPDVVGDSEAAARAALEDVGFEVIVTRTQTTNTANVGNVVAQSPGAGTTARLGASVTITVAEAAPEPEPEPTPTPTPPAPASPQATP